MPRHLCYSSRKLALDNILREFIIPDYKLVEVSKRISNAFLQSLNDLKDEYHYSPLKMLPTHLSLLPNGTEAGRFIAIDLGGTNLRFLLIHVVDGQLRPTSVRHKVPANLMTGRGEDLFDFMSECIQKGLQDLEMEDQEIDYLGFTFSFPCNQVALNSGYLVRWTKGFCASGVEGHDVVALLRKACQKRNLKIKDYILINDTTGTLLCGAFEDKHAKIGVINGTGTNACYLEKISKIKKWKAPSDNTHSRIIINTEWGAFGANSELAEFSTDVDVDLDKNSLNPGHQLFEKMISGMYLGNIVRGIVLKAIDQGLLFDNSLKEIFSHSESLESYFISLSYDKEKFIEIFNSKFSYLMDDMEFELMAKICDTVSRRSAALCAAGLASLLKRIECPRGVIAADGSLFTQHPKFVEYVSEKLNFLTEDKTFKIILVNDGSGKGAALAACVASIECQKTLCNDT